MDTFCYIIIGKNFLNRFRESSFFLETLLYSLLASQAHNYELLNVYGLSHIKLLTFCSFLVKIFSQQQHSTVLSLDADNELLNHKYLVIGKKTLKV